MRPVALKALQEMHGTDSVDGLIKVADATKDAAVRTGALGALARLFNIEKPWNLTSWWETRPDDRGPYFEPVTWDASPRIKEAIERNFGRVPAADQNPLIDLFARNRLPVADFKLAGLDPVVAALGMTMIDGPQLRVVLDAAKDSKRPWDQRVACYRALDHAPADQMTASKLALLAVFSAEPGAPASVNQLVSDFVNDPKRGTEIPQLRDFAAKQSDAASRIAWMSMLTVLNSPLAKPDSKKKVQEELDKNPRVVGLFYAIRDLKLSGFDKQIDVGINSDNELLINAAKSAKEASIVTAGNGKKVGELPAAEVMKAAMSAKGDVATGQRLFTAQGCIACHSVDASAAQKGPYLGAAGAKFTRDYLIDSVLEPSKVVAQGFQTIQLTMNDGSVNMGFITGEADGVIEMRNITGQVTKLKRADVKGEERQAQSMMPPGLASGLSVEDFTSLIEYLNSLKAVGG
jgi:putative heme-binding domain-containing protein